MYRQRANKRLKYIRAMLSGRAASLMLSVRADRTCVAWTALFAVAAKATPSSASAAATATRARFVVAKLETHAPLVSFAVTHVSTNSGPSMFTPTHAAGAP